MVPNAGLLLNRTVYQSIVKHRDQFEHQLNPNWDCSLADLTALYPTMGQFQLTAHLTRIRNIGAIGIHDDQVSERLLF